MSNHYKIFAQQWASSIYCLKITPNYKWQINGMPDRIESHRKASGVRTHTFNRIHFHMVREVSSDFFLFFGWHNWKYCVNVSVKWTRNQTFPLPIYLFSVLLWLTIGKECRSKYGCWKWEMQLVTGRRGFLRKIPLLRITWKDERKCLKLFYLRLMKIFLER